LLVVVKIVVLPLPAWALLPGALGVLRSGLLPTSMLRMVPTGTSQLVPPCIASEGRSYWSRVITTVLVLWVQVSLTEALLRGAASFLCKSKTNESTAYKPRFRSGNGISVI
jgi:hypothetical protein